MKYHMRRCFPIIVAIMFFAINFFCVSAYAANKDKSGNIISGIIGFGELNNSVTPDVYEGKDGDIIISYFRKTHNGNVMTIWSLRKRKIIGQASLGLDMKRTIESITGERVNKVKGVTMAAVGAYNPAVLMRESRIALPDGTFLQYQEPDGPTGACTAVEDEDYEKVDSDGNTIIKKSLIFYFPNGVGYNNSKECLYHKPQEIKIKYRSAWGATIFKLESGLLFIGFSGYFLLTDFSLDSPPIGSSSILVEYKIVNGVLSTAKGAKDADERLDRVLRSYKK